jgi:hypothetical protein
MDADPTQRGLFNFDGDADDDDLYGDDDFDGDELDEEDDLYEDRFGLVVHDKPVIDKLIDCVRNVIARPDVIPYQIHSLAILLFALERLPAPTPDVHITLGIGRQFENGESRFWNVELSDREMRFGSTSYVIINPDMGGDGISYSVFEAGVGGYRMMENPFAVVSWLDEIEAACTRMDESVDVTNYGEDAPRWSDEADPEIWDQLNGYGGWFSFLSRL